MTSQRLQPGAVGVIVGCAVSLCIITPAGPADISQVIVGNNERPTFVTWPEKGLGLSIDLTGFKKEIDQVKPDGRRYLMASHPKTKLDVSITLEKVTTKASATGCLEQLRLIQNDSSVTRGQDIALNTTGEIPTLEYTIQKFRGVRVDQKNVYACIAQDNVYADIHLSKAQYTAADARFFQSILKTLRLQPPPSEIVPPPAPAPPKEMVRLPAPAPPKEMIRLQPPAPPNSMELLNMGNALYRQYKYGRAIAPYQKAFELEKAEPQLDRILWRTLIDNLGMAYGKTGHLKEAKDIFEQGIQADPTYPMFHYNLACTFADMNDLDHAMQSLKTAFRHRKNQNPGEEGMPDPRQNTSFQRFMKHDTFRNLVDDLAATKS
ncbi:MAG TPA: tetratricopeptide repeat protein [Nitrospiraceae bacterium]|nr:tetratricopeptide repeat protein [Nitrospiraceae bacterium]